MEKQAERKVFEIVEVVILSTLLVVRLFSNSEENNWINLLNFIGLIVAFTSLYMSIRMECSVYKKFDIITGAFVLILIALTIVLSFILTGFISLNTKWNDIILIITLLISLPTKLYCNIIGDIIKD